ncbi:MAG: HAMP domain-containing histidine kinase [Promethearchaeota archaeon]|nr:MAG: HAMP domain-containing histidine kinase [Candidatus Lokiarchaeota archaeon]
MPSIDLTYLEIVLAVITIIGSTVFLFVTLKRRDLKYWLFTYISLTLAYISNSIRVFVDIFETISYILFGLTVILANIAIFIEYHDTFIKKPLTISSKLTLLVVLMISDYTYIGLVCFLILLILIGFGLLVRITFKKKTLTHVFLCFAELGALFSAIGNLFILFNMEAAQEINIGADIFFVTILFVTGIVAYLEERLTESERKYKEFYNRESFYKDLVAHDINNVLQSIESSAELLSIYLKGSEKENESQELTEIIKEQVERGAKLVSNIRMLSDLDNEEISLEPIDLLKYLEKAINFIEKSSPERNINIHIENPYEYINVLANELIIEVFDNILTNAVKHNQQSQVEILIRIRKEDRDDHSYYKFEFIDNGDGVPDYLKEKIFQRLYGKSKTVGGMGLGLSLVKKIITHYDGYIWVEDKVKGKHKKGSKFIILLPISINR